MSPDIQGYLREERRDSLLLTLAFMLRAHNQKRFFLLRRIPFCPLFKQSSQMGRDNFPLQLALLHKSTNDRSAFFPNSLIQWLR
jgi:hypothetical protein